MNLIRVAAVVHLCFSSATALASSEFHLLRCISVGRRPDYIVVNRAKEELYVANHHDRSITVINISTNEVVGTISIACDPFQIACSPDGSKLFVSSEEGVIAIDARTRTPKTVNQGLAREIVFSPDGRRLYIAAERNGLLAMDTTSYSVTVLHRAQAPYGLALSPDGGTLFVNYRSGGPGGRDGHDVIGVFDTRSGVLSKTIKDLANVGGRLALSPDGKHLWALGTDACSSQRYDHKGCELVPAGTVNVVDVFTGKLVRTLNFPGPWQPDNITFSPRGSWAALSRGMVILIDTRQLEIRASAPQIMGWSSAFRRDGELYVSIPLSNCVALVSCPREGKAPTMPTTSK